MVVFFLLIFSPPGVSHRKLAMDAFIRAIEGEQTDYPNLLDGLRAQMTAEAAVESLKSNRPVKITYWQPE